MKMTVSPCWGIKLALLAVSASFFMATALGQSNSGWTLVAHMKNSGNMFPGDSNLSPTYSYGTFVENPSPSTLDFYRPFAADSSEILFITGNGKYYARGKYAEVLQVVNARAGDFGPNINFTISVNGIVSTMMCNILSRDGAFVDPWISLATTHNPSLIVWGEDGFAGVHSALKNNNDGINVYVLPAASAAPTPAPLPPLPGWTLVAHMKNSGNMFPGDSNLSPTYSYGTFVESPSPSTLDFYRPFAADSSEILFITGNGKYYARGKYAEVLQVVNAHAGDFGPNINFTISVNGIVSTMMCNILSRGPASGYFEDPWISLATTHNPSLIVWGEDGFIGDHSALKNNNDGINVYVLPAPTVSGGATGDPHLVGGNGAKYLFAGQSGGIYSFFSSPWYEVAIQLSTGDTRHGRFIVAIGVLFGRESFFYNGTADTASSPSFNEADLKGKLKRAGGDLHAFSSEGATLQLCPGHTLTFRKRASYLDIAMAVPECHDGYEGALGQTFQCKYVLNHEAFVWSSAQEESFRLPSILTPAGAFQVNATCPAPFAGQKRKTKAGNMRHSASSLSGKSKTKKQHTRL